MFFSSTRTVLVLAFLMHNVLAFSQNPECLTPTFFKTSGAADKTEYGTVIIKSSDGNLYLAGRNGSRTFIQKTTLAGDILWFREFQLSQFEPVTPAEIIEDSEGMIVGCGTQTQFAGARRGFVFRYDPVNNQFLWAHPIASNNPTSGGIVEKAAGGNYVYYQNPILANGETDIELLDLERATGNIMPAFASRYEHIGYDKLSKLINVDGSLYGLGWSEGRVGTNLDARRVLMARFDPVNGTPIWAKLGHLDTTEQRDMYGRDLIADGESLVAAYIGTETNNPDSYRLFLQKTDLDGNIEWVRSYEIYSSVLKLINTPDGYVIYGNRYASEHIVLKTDKNGVPLWARRLTVGADGSIDEGNNPPNLGVIEADSLYFTGIAATGFSDVFFWKMLTDGSMVDSCGYVDSLSIGSQLVANPVNVSINLTQLITTAVPFNSNVPWTTNTLEELLLCPDCTVPDPCPEDNDFVVNIETLNCAAGKIQLSVNFCELNGGPVSEGLQISFYNGNPFTTGADRLATIEHDSLGAGTLDSCSSFMLNDLENLFGLDALQNGAQIFAVVNAPANASTPFALVDFPLSELGECNYANNIDSFTVQLPVAPTLNLGADQSICSNETATLNAGPGFFKYQWSNGATTQSTNISFGGSYRITVTDACGFQQTDTVAVQVRQLPLILENAAFCPGKSVTVRGFTFDQVGTFQKILPGAGADCDTSATFFISELPYVERIETVYFCPFETVTINGVTYEDSGLVRDTLPSSTTCDTIVFYFLNQLPLPFRVFNFEICPGETIDFNGITYNQSASFTDTLYSSGFACDTIAYVTIDLVAQPEKVQTIQFCPGTSVNIGGQLYTQPGTVQGTTPSLTGGCDTLVTYTLEWLPAPEISETVQFCPGSSVTLGGQVYTQPGTVLLTLPGGNGDCDTLLTVTLQFSPAPTKAATLEFCAGGSIVLGGQTYTQPTVVTLYLPGNNGGCDTVATYTLQYLDPGPSTMTLACPSSITVDASIGGTSAAANYNPPVPSSDCDCPGIDLTLTNGLVSGSLFPLGNTQVCYRAEDKCGTVANCCFSVTVSNEAPCDTKTNGCVQYDLLSITADAQQRRTYTIRVTNNCANKLIYTAIQLPDGLTAVAPANLSTYSTPDARKYTVRNPNYAPFYSIRFKSTTDSISNGESDVFQYTLPAQANPTFINITSRLVTQNFYGAHLNTFNCPITQVTSQNRSEEGDLQAFEQSLNLEGLLLFPNPSNGELFADLSRWQGQDLTIQILDSRGARTQSISMQASSEAQAIPLTAQMPSGLYFLEVVSENGTREVARFILER